MMADVLANPVFVVGLLLFVLVLLALAWVGSRQPYVREIERIREDLHNLVARRNEKGARIAVNGA